MNAFVKNENTDSNHGPNVTMKRIIERLNQYVKQTHNDADLGAKVRIMFNDLGDLNEFLQIDFPNQNRPFPTEVVDKW